MKEREEVGGYNKEDYQTERLYATAKDGTKVPISLGVQENNKERQ